MIGYFPEPYPDESLYSVLARCVTYNITTKFKLANSHLFASPTYPSSSTIDLPRAIGALEDGISSIARIEKHKILFEHTLWPFYRNFVEPMNIKLVEEALLDNTVGGSAIHLLSGLNSSSFIRQTLPKYCIVCAKQDEKTFGEPYWHRTHSIPNMNICPEHLIRLQVPDTPTMFSRRNAYVPLSTIVRQNEIEYVHNQIVVKYAHYLGRFLFRRENCRAKNYKESLSDLGFISLNSKIDYNNINTAIRPYLHAIEPIFYTMTENKYWLRDICNRPYRTFDPFRHTLLQFFLKEQRKIPLPSINLSQHQDFFGKGPYVCINKAADHYKQPVIATVKFYKCRKRKRIVGKFACQCGMVYTKSFIPGQGGSTTFQSITIFGHVWDKQLKNLSKNSLSLRAIAKQLGVDPKTVIRQASLAGIQHSWSTKACTTVDNTRIDQATEKKAVKRKEWEDTLGECGMSIKAARNISNTSYTWLYRNDREWLMKQNSSFKVKVTSTYKTRRNWPERDQEIVRLLKTSINRLYPLPKQRVSISYLLHTLPCGYSYVAKNLNKLPSTKSFLYETAESLLQYQLRRVACVIEELREQAIPLSRWRIIRAAGLRLPMFQEVNKYIDIVVEEVW